MRRELNEPVHLGKALMELSEVLGLLNQREARNTALDDAQFVLEQAPANAELARVYSQRAAFYMLQNKWELAERWGRRAIALARQFNAFQTEAHALNSIGSAMLDDAQDCGYNLIMQSLQIALRNELRSDAARAYLNFSEACIRNRDLARAQPMLNEGLKFVQNYDLDKYNAVLLSMQSNVHQMHGRLDEALQVARSALVNSALATPIRNGPNTVLGTVILQQDLTKGRDLLQQVWSNVFSNAQPDFVAPAAIGIAEGAWLAGDLKACLDIVKLTMSLGSAALARKLARQHSRTGVKGIKVSPHAASRKNPFGLTPREL